MIVRELITRLGFDLNDAPLKKAHAGIASFKSAALALTGIVAGASAGLFAVVKSAANFGDGLYKTSQRIGIGVESLQKLQYAAGLADLENAEFSQGIALLSRKLGEAAKGGKEAAGTFSKMGIRVKDAHGKIRPTDQLFLEISDRFSKMQDGAEKTALSMDIFGRSGARMIPLLNAGSAEIIKMGREIEDLGLIIGVDAAKAGEQFNDNLRRMRVIFSGIKNVIGARLLPEFLKLTQRFLEWIRANKEMLKLRLEQFFRLMARSIEIAWIFVKRLYEAFDSLAEFVGGARNAVVILTAAAVALGLAFGFLNPITLAVGVLAAAFVALYDDFQAFNDGRDHLLDWPTIIEKVRSAVQFLSDSWAGLKIVVMGVKDTIEDLLAPFQKVMDLAARFGNFHMRILGINPAEFSKRFSVSDQTREVIKTVANPTTMLTAPFQGLAAIGREARGQGVQNNNVKNDVRVEVNVGADANGKEIGDAVGKAIEEKMGNAWRVTMRALQGAN